MRTFFKRRGKEHEKTDSRNRRRYAGGADRAGGILPPRDHDQRHDAVEGWDLLRLHLQERHVHADVERRDLHVRRTGRQRRCVHQRGGGLHDCAQGGLQA